MRRLLQLTVEEKKRLKHLTNFDSEIGGLFGLPLPRLPQGDENEEGEKRIFVDFPPDLGILLRNFLQALYPVISNETRDTQKMEESIVPLQKTLIKIAEQAIQQDRRSGLVNLYYLALSKILSGVIQTFFSQGGRKSHYKYHLHSKLNIILSRVHEEAMKRVDARVPGSVSYGLGEDFNPTLLQAIFEDQLPIITTETEEVNVQDVLGSDNPRFTFSLNHYNEIYGILATNIRRAIERKDLKLINRIRDISCYPGIIDSSAISKLMQRKSVVQYLFLDYSEVGKKILASRHIDKKKVSFSELGSDYLGLMDILKRNEIIQLLKRSVEILSERQAARAEDLYSEGSLYRFYGAGKILNETRNVTTVFMDLRGFTKKSEEAISAGELTDELYAVFDPMTKIVKELHGKIDKFTGDGMMVTFGVDSRSKEDPLNALRMAIRVQETIRSLRKKSRTKFQMGIAIHSGAAFVANFIADDQRVENTVIGRNVNIAGRLSSAGDVNLLHQERKEFDDLIESLSRSLSSSEQDLFLGTLESRKSTDKTVSGVSVDPKGNLYNLGIVLSQQSIHAIDQVVHLKSGEDNGVGSLSYMDDVLSRQISLYYVGDAKFKGVESAFPVYAVLL